ncbi:InlB B-repeat-containing protein, partial [Klebsiella pneumoniae]|uniref:InlB B-repeat-containing protein n=1 Tax=Klebsiella pneumoniae TaxID=573 RepID=UPI001C8F23E0
VTIADNIANGSVTTDKDRYVIGDQVTLTVAGADGYYYDSLKVDGKEVVADANGTYTFTITKQNHTVEASFAPAIFNTNAEYNVLSQNIGVLRV